MKSLRARFTWLIAMAPSVATAAVFTVNNAADAGPGTLRQALLDANAMQVSGGTACAPHTISFAIPGNAPHTIQPLSALPSLQIAMTLDAYTQPGSQPNTLLLGNNAIPGIELDGSFAGSSSAIVVAPAIPGSGLCSGNGALIRGFAINRFAGSAIRSGADVCSSGQGCSSGGLIIQGNFIGTDVSGMIALGNGASSSVPAIYFGSFSTNNIIGDQILEAGGPSSPVPAHRNVIAGNTGDGIAVMSAVLNSQASLIKIRNNFIGVNGAGTGALPNGGNGIVIGSNNALTAVQDNVISANLGDGVAIVDSPFGATLLGNAIGVDTAGLALGNGGHGVYVSNSQRVTIARRSSFISNGAPSLAHNGGAGVFIAPDALVDVLAVPIAANGGLGIDLAPLGANANDLQDPDLGANEGLNTPLIDSVTTNTATGTGNIQGRIQTNPGSTVEVHFFTNPNCDPSGNGEGQTPFGTVNNVMADAMGNGTYNVNTNFLPAGQFLTAIARRFSSIPGVNSLEVSEFSPCTPIIATGPHIFSNGFE